MNSQKQRIRMRTWQTFICVLGVIYSKASGQDNSTKMMFAVLTVEASIIPNITELIKSFVLNSTVKVSGTTTSVNDLQVTTECGTVMNETQCTCKPNYIWSDTACTSNPVCTFSTPVNNTQMCTPSAAVTVKGSIVLPLEYSPCLSTKDSAKCNELSTQMKQVYSTLRKFNSLHITQFSSGSVIADFLLTVNAYVPAADLATKTLKLQNQINATFSLKTTGLVSIFAPSDPVNYSSDQNISCKTSESIDTSKPNKVWDLSSVVVTNGTESTVTLTSGGSLLNLKRTSEVWKGIFTCTLQSSSNITMLHKASANLDVALLPNIFMGTNPQFPRCYTTTVGPPVVRVLCETVNYGENYTVSWSTYSPSEILSNTKSISKSAIVYEANISISCDPNPVTQNVTCTFMNRNNQKQRATIPINIICSTCKYCATDSDWPEVKAGFEGILRCTNRIGNRTRKCLNSSIWDAEKSYCVNFDLQNILSDSKQLLIGLGSVAETAPAVFRRLSVSTNNTASINSYANVDTSVQIISTMSQLGKQQTMPESIIENFIESSSNILSDSLKNAWVLTDPNSSLAERFLSSFEGLVNVTNIKTTNTSNQPNVQLSSCFSNTSQNCSIANVFNVTFMLYSTGPNQTVTTVGFKNLKDYLPNKVLNSTPNSLVVSMIQKTVNGGNQQNNIQITFPLIVERPPNRKMYCVYWDVNTSDWSKEGCTWGGPYNENICKCNHLSSFTILMSKEDITLPYMNEITNVGLAVSIVSLILCLMIYLLVWNSVVRSNVSYFRLAAYINISLCLLMADCCFLASSSPKNLPESWCQILVVLKHFFYLAMFFWMLCLSLIILHQMVFVFHHLSRKAYLGFTFFLGYFCPVLIVAITFITYDNGQKDHYYSVKTCWLIYEGVLRGSIHSFVIPIGTIVVINVFCMMVVITRLLNPVAEASTRDEKDVAKSILRIIVMLTPVFGVTWLLGFFVLTLDLTVGALASFVNYAFTLLNSFQGFFLLLTSCVGEKMVRDALLRRFHLRHSPSTESESFTKLTSSMKKN